jgi:hypothetical protein
MVPLQLTSGFSDLAGCQLRQCTYAFNALLVWHTSNRCFITSSACLEDGM